jgi:hypothetical protein
MSLETKIEQLTAAVIAMTETFRQGAALVEPTAVAAPVAAPVVAAAPIAAPVFAVPVFAPAAPVFAAPAAPVAAPVVAVPFSDAKGLLEWIMKKYQALGPVKGAEIQNVLVSLGYQNINDVRVESYAALFTKVESLQ